jgi:UDP-N-acetylglucosamine acyltransferase
MRERLNKDAMEIHPSAVVSPKAELGPGVTVGPFSHVGEGVTIGPDTTVGSHVIIEGVTRIGERNKIFHFSSIGSAPQDIAYRGEPTELVIGNDNVIREYVTINRATTKESGKTVIGNNNYIMAYAHVAHDCVLGDRVIMSNVATLGGHIHIGDGAIIGGLVAIHQFVRIGDFAFLGGKSGVDRDVPPFMMTAGPRAKLYGVNRKGLSRMGMSQEKIDGLKKAYRIIWRDHIRFTDGVARVREEIPAFPELELLLTFFNGSKRGILR